MTRQGNRVDELCCPVEYDRRYLDVITDEILERDYGCGDPSRSVRPGETVLDLGCGGGKICYIAAQIVGPQGRVIGVDTNDEMLVLAESHHQSIAGALGYDNVTFRKGKIQDLALDHERLAAFLACSPVHTLEDLAALETWREAQIRMEPLIATGSIDVVVSNCVLNLVAREDRTRMFAEIHRVLNSNGRAVISDIVGSRDVPEDLQADPELWSGCVSGAFREDRFLEAFAGAGFHGVRVVRRDERPWRVVRGIEFRSVTVEAHKSEQAPDTPATEERDSGSGCCGASSDC